MSTKKLTTEDFKNRSILKHDGKYTYPNAVYVDRRTEICITCPVHGDFWQDAGSHMYGRGCPKCGDSRKGGKLSYSNQLIDEKLKDKNFQRIGNLVNGSTPLLWKCKISTCEFEWKTSPRNIFNRNSGCPKCSGKARITDEDIDEILASENRKIKRIGNKIDGMSSKIEWFCLVCEKPFKAAPSHIIYMKTGCTRCKLSHGEIKIENFLEEHNIEFDKQKRFKECRRILPLPFDFYLPELNVCIEFDGEHHHGPYRFLKNIKSKEESEKMYELQKIKDEIKDKFCHDNGIELIRIHCHDSNNIDEILTEKLLSLSSIT